MGNAERFHPGPEAFRGHHGGPAHRVRDHHDQFLSALAEHKIGIA